jgi:farnesyl-diphosphate farnesyltransferase
MVRSAIFIEREESLTKRKSMLKILEETSRTFYLPIVRLPQGLQEAVASAYLCMRAIDEIEDHPTLDPQQKSKILQSVSFSLQGQHSVDNFKLEELKDVFRDLSVLPEVTLRLGEWAILAPSAIAPRIWDATAAMAERMAMWAQRGWSVVTQSDLDRYTFSVAGAIGLLLCDLWGWFEGLQPERSHAISFGRGLQAVNILRNRKDDLKRGVDFYPEGWGDVDMENYARDHLSSSENYSSSFPALYKSFIAIPHALAIATLDARSVGKQKLSRTDVLQIVSQLDRA